MSVETRFILTIALIVASTAAGYLARRFGLLRESLARPIMTGMMVVVTPVVGLLAVWEVHLSVSDIWLPTLGFVHATFLVILSLWIARALFRDRQDQGLFGLSCAAGNHGIAMAGFVIFLLSGEQGLGYSTVHNLYCSFALVFLCYPIAKYYSPNTKTRSLGRLLVSGLADVRSIALPACAVGILLNISGLPRPRVFSNYKIVDILVYLVIVMAYVSIGLRLHVGRVWKIKGMILGMLGVRHLIGPALGVGLLSLTLLTPWPLSGLRKEVFLIQSSVPMAVMGVAAANIFHLKPHEASAMFVVSSLVYLALGLPIIVWLFGGN